MKGNAPPEQTSGTPGIEPNQMRKFALDFGPLLVFFAANYWRGDLIFAVKILVAATVVSLVVGYALERKVSMMALFGCMAVAFFGGLSVYFESELFIKVKPTVVTLIMAALIAGGRLVGRNPLAAVLGSQLRMSEKGWSQISWIWVAMFVTSAVANEIAWRTLSTDAWVTFKVFGLTGISLCFAVLSMPVLMRHQQK